MATSINEAVNWRKTAVTPDYKVEANRVDTFVQGETNPKGKQIAAALESAAGTLGSFAQGMAQKEERELTKAEKQQELLDILEADNQSASQRELANQWLAETDLSSFNNPDEALAQYSKDVPAYQDAVSGFATDGGRIHFAREFGDVWNQGFYEKKKEAKDFKTATTLNNHFMKELNRDGQTAQAMSADDPRFSLLIKDLEDVAFGLGYETPESRYKLLASVAEQQFRENKDERLFDRLQGNIAGKTAIGGTEFQNDLATKREAIRKFHVSQENETRLKKERAVKAAKVDMAREAATILAGGEGDLLEVAQRYADLGVENSFEKVKGMQDAYQDLDDVDLNPEAYGKVWVDFLRLETPSEQSDYIMSLVENDGISRALMSQLFSRVGSDDNKAMFSNNLVWKSIEKGVTALATDKDSGFALAEYQYLDGVGKQLWIEQYTSPDWKNKTLQEQMTIANTILKTLKDVTELETNEYRLDAMPDARRIFQENTIDRQLDSLNQPQEGESPAEAVERLKKLREQMKN